MAESIWMSDDIICGTGENILDNLDCFATHCLVTEETIQSEQQHLDRITLTYRITREAKDESNPSEEGKSDSCIGGNGCLIDEMPHHENCIRWIPNMLRWYMKSVCEAFSSR